VTTRVDPGAAGIVMVVVGVVVLGARTVVVVRIVVVVVVVGGIVLVDVDVDVDVEVAGPDVARTASSIPHADVHAITATAAKVRAVRNMAFKVQVSSLPGTVGARRAQGRPVPLRLLPTRCSSAYKPCSGRPLSPGLWAIDHWVCRLHRQGTNGSYPQNKEGGLCTSDWEHSF
jgi:hypothetical protein